MMMWWCYFDFFTFQEGDSDDDDDIDWDSDSSDSSDSDIGDDSVGLSKYTAAMFLKK